MGLQDIINKAREIAVAEATNSFLEKEEEKLLERAKLYQTYTSYSNAYNVSLFPSSQNYDELMHTLSTVPSEFSDHANNLRKEIEAKIAKAEDDLMNKEEFSKARKELENNIEVSLLLDSKSQLVLPFSKKDCVIPLVNALYQHVASTIQLHEDKYQENNQGYIRISVSKPNKTLLKTIMKTPDVFGTEVKNNGTRNKKIKGANIDLNIEEIETGLQYVVKPRKKPKVSQQYFDVPLTASSLDHAILYFPRRSRHHMPVKGVEFILHTDDGKRTAKMTSSATLGYMTGRLGKWYKAHPELKIGSYVRMHIIDKHKEYRLEVSPDQPNQP